MQWQPEYTGILIKLSLAVVLGGLCGIERERKGRGAGLSTHVLVCLGSAAAMMLGNLFSEEAFARENITAPVDKGRVIQGVLTGIGFLGAGTIINVGFQNRGLTTAAMIWLTAALGIVIGAGEYVMAFAITGFALFTTVVLEKTDRFFHYPERFNLSIYLKGGVETIGSIKDAVAKMGHGVRFLKMDFDEGDGQVMVQMEITSWSKPQPEALARELKEQFETLQRVEYLE